MVSLPLLRGRADQDCQRALRARLSNNFPPLPAIQKIHAEGELEEHADDCPANRRPAKLHHPRSLATPATVELSGFLPVPGIRAAIFWGGPRGRRRRWWSRLMRFAYRREKLRSGAIV